MVRNLLAAIEGFVTLSGYLAFYEPGHYVPADSIQIPARCARYHLQAEQTSYARVRIDHGGSPAGRL